MITPRIRTGQLQTRLHPWFGIPPDQGCPLSHSGETNDQFKDILTSRDLRLLEDLIAGHGIDPGLAAVLREKVGSATIVLPEDVPADIVTLDSRVQFAVDGRRDERRLIASASREFRGHTLLVGTPLGRRCWACASAIAGQRSASTARRLGSR